MTPRRIEEVAELHKAGKSLVKLAEANGWKWRCDFCEPDSYVIRFIRPWRERLAGERVAAVAYWSGGKFQGAWRADPRTRLKSAELREYLK